MLKGFFIQLELEELKERLGNEICREVDIEFNIEQNIILIKIENVENLKDIKRELKTILNCSEHLIEDLTFDYEHTKCIYITLSDASNWLSKALELKDKFWFNGNFLLEMNDNEEQMISLLYEKFPQ